MRGLASSIDTLDDNTLPNNILAALKGLKAEWQNGK